MSVVKIGSPQGVRFDGRPGDDYLTVGLALPDVTATKRIYGHYASGFEGLIEYFRDLADH